MTMTGVAGTLSALAFGVALAGCSVSPASSTSNGSNTGGHGSNAGGGGNGGGGGVTFNVTVNWSGPDPVQGTFTDSETGSGYSSCSEYATRTGHLWLSPSPNNKAQVQGKTLGFLYNSGSTAFHGPGTYPNSLAAGVTVGSDTFLAGNGAMSSMTLNSDGSGSASFSGLINLSGGSETPESGSITWTCSG